jgi:acyl-CoA synthetase (AMP-forming)/AMP-acid ligase II
LPEYKGKIKEQEIIEYLRGRVAPYAVPKSVEFRDASGFPRTSAGVDKISKRTLRQQEVEKMKERK